MSNYHSFQANLARKKAWLLKCDRGLDHCQVNYLGGQKRLWWATFKSMTLERKPLNLLSTESVRIRYFLMLAGIKNIWFILSKVQIKALGSLSGKASISRAYATDCPYKKPNCRSNPLWLPLCHLLILN